MSDTAQLLRPHWPALPGVDAAMGLRGGGVSRAPWDRLNISVSVGDDAAAVAENRARYSAALGVQPVWLRLVHGADVLRLHANGPQHPYTPADAAWTTARGVACTVTAADCLPVFFALRDGSAVGAAHAGWRGLAAGVLEATLRAICEGTGAAPSDVQVWLGPCIGPRQFEVGADVLQAFGADAVSLEANVDPRGATAGTTTALPSARHFTPRLNGSPGAARWLADLRGLAADRLRAAGVLQLSASTACTVEDASRFFSFRRDRHTGRHAASIWRL